MSRSSVSAFFATVGQDLHLTRQFLAVVEGKHSAEAIMAIADFARELGFDLSFEDIRGTQTLAVEALPVAGE